MSGLSKEVAKEHYHNFCSKEFPGRYDSYNPLASCHRTPGVARIQCLQHIPAVGDVVECQAIHHEPPLGNLFDAQASGAEAIEQEATSRHDSVSYSHMWPLSGSKSIILPASNYTFTT